MVYPDPDHLAHHDEPLLDFRLARPLALINPPPGQITTASHGALNHAVSVITTVAGATTRLVDHWTTEQGTAELELMAAGLNVVGHLDPQVMDGPDELPTEGGFRRPRFSRFASDSKKKSRA